MPQLLGAARRRGEVLPAVREPRLRRKPAAVAATRVGRSRKDQRPPARAGVLFLLALVLAPAAIIAGFALGVKALIFVGVVLAVALVLLLILGNFV